MVESGSRRLADRYEVRSLIGRGGMAQVHLGFDTRLSRVVAIKMLRTDLARDAIFQARFRREAQASASLNHPNIVGVYDTGEEEVVGADGAPFLVPFIVMEYVEGHTVKELLSDGTPVPISEAVEISAGILSAIEYSHANGLVHRDIKPGNVMITSEGKIKVMDFGIARAITDSQATMTQTNVVVGTAQYLSPEQARGEQVDERSDIYSAGCVLFELLTGKPPFTGDSAVSVAYQHVSEIPAAPSTIAGDIPESLDRVVLKAMAKNPEDRYATAIEMRHDMVRAAQGMEVEAPETAVWAATAATTPLTAQMAATQVQNSIPSRTATNGVAVPTESTTQTTTSGAAVAAPAKKKRTGLVVGLALLALLLVGGAVAAFLATSAPKTAETTVPNNLIGMTQEEARTAIETANLVFAIGDAVENDTIEAGKVAAVNPPGGTKLEEGATVTVRLSAGPESVTIPQMEGWDQESVRTELRRLGFEVGLTETVDESGVAKGGLVRTDPAMGSSQPKGTTVNIYFSSGNVQIPSDLVGQSESDVVGQLNALGLNTNVVYEHSSTYPDGIVISVSSSGTTTSGSTVTVVVSSGPSPTPTPTPTPEPEPTQSPNNGNSPQPSPSPGEDG